VLNKLQIQIGKKQSNKNRGKTLYIKYQILINS